MRLSLRTPTVAIALVVVAVAALTATPSLAWGVDLATVPGSSEKVGTGTTYRFKVQVQRSINIDRRGFAGDVEDVLLDGRSWTGSGAVAFRRVDQGGNTRIILAKPRQVDRLCHPLQTAGKFSCRIGRKVVLNLRRWRQGVPSWNDSRLRYRQMLVNHEVGHRIGHGHRDCPNQGANAPVMQQQTIDLQGCEAYWWPTNRELRATRQLHGAAAATAGGATVE